MNISYKIGLEIHVQLVGSTKAFADEAYAFGASPNSQTGYISLGLPGTLPRLNKTLLEKAYRLSRLSNCSISPVVRFDRKAYFYPDLPKAYQITQKNTPLGKDGIISFPDNEGRIKEALIERIHMEEDSGKTLHSGTEHRLDYNRAGVALIEIVTAPCFYNLEDVISFLKYLQLLLRYYEISEARMEQGEMRVDGNLSISKGGVGWSLPSEIKNMNSFNYLRKAMQQLIVKMDTSFKEASRERYTYTFDEHSGELIKLRGKEDATTYRYMPEPDLGGIHLEDVIARNTDETLAILPIKIYGKMLEQSISAQVAREIVFDLDLLNIWNGTSDQVKSQLNLARMMVGPLRAIQKKAPLQFSEMAGSEKFIMNLVELLNLIHDKQLNKNTAREKVLPLLFERPNKKLRELVEERGWLINNPDDSLFHTIDVMLQKYPRQVQAYQNGKIGIAGFFMGKLMKTYGSSMDPKELMDHLKASLEKYRPGDTKKSE